MRIVDVAEDVHVSVGIFHRFMDEVDVLPYELRGFAVDTFDEFVFDGALVGVGIPKKLRKHVRAQFRKFSTA